MTPPALPTFRRRIVTAAGLAGAGVLAGALLSGMRPAAPPPPDRTARTAQQHQCVGTRP